MTFYEQLGIVIPGSVFMFGLVLYFPTLRFITDDKAMSVGEFGVFVLLAYAAGHLIAAVANGLESVFWHACGGMPSDWIVTKKTTLLSPHQIELLRERVVSRLGIKLDHLEGLERKVWWPISRQIYADVAKNGKPDRIDTFNGNYGLNRGISAACFVLIVPAVIKGQWLIGFGLLIAALLYGYRAYRFGVHYAREMYLQFLVLS